MDGQVLKVTELNPRLGMEVTGLLREEGAEWLEESELFVRFGPDGRVLGVACISEFDEDCLISLVVVKGDSKGKGTGSSLINHILGYFSGRCDRVYVLAGEARGFFQRFGFRGVSPDDVPEPIIGFCKSRSLLNRGGDIMMLNLPRSWTM